MPKTPRKKPAKKARPKKVNVSIKSKWERILKDIDSEDVPISMLEGLQVNLVDGTSIVINIKQLLEDGVSSTDIEAQLNLKFSELDQYIHDIDFFVDLDSVASHVQPATDKLLKHLL